MFVGFSKRLKRMGGFRLGVGFRVNKWVAIFLLPLVAMFYMMWYLLIAGGWMVYGLCWVYYQMFKYIGIGIKNLYIWIAGKIKTRQI